MKIEIVVLSIISFSTMLVHNSECGAFNDVDLSQLDIADSNGHEIDEIDGRRIFYPGTKWCGPGNKADNYDDLGSAVETDKCCREHDHCPDLILKGDTKHNLTNDGGVTKVNCACDDRFHSCLHDAAKTEKRARFIGWLYFNNIKTECFKEDYPARCTSVKMGIQPNKCLEYEYDTSGQKRYQWFDVRSY